MSRVQIQSLVKDYQNTRAVAGIDLDIEEGEFVVLLGPSGCGKTTTLRCVAGLEDVSDGRIVMGERVVSERGRSLPPEQREIGMVFQSYAIWPHMTVAENVAFGLKMKKVPRGDMGGRVQAALDLVGLGGFGDRHVSRLSGGQQQRVALARAMALEPRVLLFDEPLSNLDAKLRERMRFELRQLQRRLGITSIYVTHDQQEAMVVADRIVLMRNGVIEQIGTPIELYRRPATLFGAEFVGLANILPGTVAATDGQAGVEVAPGLVMACDADGRVPGEPVNLVFRPEALRVSTTRMSGPNVFAGRLQSSYFLGNMGDAVIRVGDLELRAQLSPPELWEEGQELSVQVPPEMIVLLDRDPSVSPDPAPAHQDDARRMA